MFETSFKNIQKTTYRKNLENFFLICKDVIEEGIMDKYELETYYKSQVKGTSHTLSFIIDLSKQKLFLAEIILKNQLAPKFSEMIKKQGLPESPEVTKSKKIALSKKYDADFEQKVLLAKQKKSKDGLTFNKKKEIL